MSVVRLLADHPKYGKKGTTNPRVPFLDANELVRAGLAERPGPAAAAPPTVPVETLESAGRRVAALEKLVDDQRADLDGAAAAAARAAERIAALEKDNKKLAADLDALRAATGKGK